MDKIDLYKKSFFNILKKNFHVFLLIFICSFSFFLNFYNISSYGYGNEYYAAAIKSMTENFKNFFFVSFDPAGIISVDKPPLGLWIQSIFVLFFGYSGYSLILPQALCGSGCCLVIYLIVSANHNKICGLFSAFIFAVTPIVVVTSRNNTIDMQLILILLIAVLCFFKHLKTNKKRYLFVSAFLIGLGFNIKTLQAYTVLPAFFITYIIFNKNNISSKVSRAVISIFILIIVSFSWMTVVDLYPSQNRPYIDNSKNNSMLELTLNYNGLDRIKGKKDINFDYELQNTSNNSKTSGDYIGTPSVLRLWSESLYGQISWLLTLAIGTVIINFKKLNSSCNFLEKASFVFWGIWLVTMFVIFSFSGFFHRYYLSMLAPSISILAGIGIGNYIRNIKSYSVVYHFIWTLILLITIGIQIVYICKYPQLKLLIISIIFIMLSLSFINIYAEFKSYDKLNNYLSSVFLIFAVTITSIYWSCTTLLYIPNLTMPSAGPELADSITNISSVFNSNSKSSSSGLQNYLVKNYKKDSFLVTSKKSVDVAKFIINTGLPCYAYGGFLGNTETLTLEKLKQYISENKITYFLISQEDMNSKNQSDIIEYVKQNGRFINPTEYGDFKSINNIHSDSIQKNTLNIGGGYNSSLYLLTND